MTGYLGAKKSLDHQSDLTLARYAMQCIHLRSTRYQVKLNSNWHEAGWIYPPYNFWIGFCQLNFYKKFQTFLEVKIEINLDNLTPCQAH